MTPTPEAKATDAENAATQIGKLITQIMKLAPVAGLYVGIKLEAASDRKEVKND